ncbi:cytochrome c oxidase subunit 4 [soil metagenome]
MKAEAWIFGITTVFLVLVTPAYWFVTDSDGFGNTGDWTGTSALVMTTLLTLMITLYLGFHARKMDARPEDRKDGEIADGAGELGFFPPYSWWPLWCGLTLAVIVYGVAAAAWWLFIIGAVLGAVALSGLVFEYYRGEHAH